MNVSYSWLQACADKPIGTPEEIEERLAARGFPVESTVDLSAGLEGLVVGRVEAVRPHPNADRLRLCSVDGGAGVVQVVCGAHNVVEGGLYPFAPVGVALPGGGRIRRVRIRGERSEGMLCSEKELDLGPDGEGILALEGPFHAGDALVTTLGLEDLRFDVEVTANRPDLLSHRGIARELAPDGEASLRLPPVPGTGFAGQDLAGLGAVEDARESSGGGVTIRIEDGELCYRYLGLRLSGVRVAASPPWLQRRLRAVGARPINNVVDATNYVLLEYGQPLHAFDLDLLKDRTVVVRRARAGEGLQTLDRVVRSLSSEMLAICDAEQPVAVAGVIGGADTEVSSQTTEILLECALFAPSSIRSTRKALGLSTEASYRFERGVDPEGMRLAIERAAELVLATAGGKVAGPLLDTCARPFVRERIALRLERVEAVLGLPFESGAIRELLHPLGLGVEVEDGRLWVDVPGYRSYDVKREADLIEEIARTYGYDRFPDQLGAFRPGSVPDHPQFQLEDAIRSELVEAGFLEAQVPAFTSRRYGVVEMLNPVSAEEAFLRSGLLPGLLSRLEHNLRRGNRDVRLFEIGTIFLPGEPGGLPTERTHVSVILHGTREPAHWSRAETAVDLWDLKGVLEGLVRVVSGAQWKLRPASAGAGDPASRRPEADLHGLFDPDQAFSVLDDAGTERGRGGRLEPGRLDLPKWGGDVWGIELALPAGPAPFRLPAFRSPPSHPSVDRDLALLLAEDASVGAVLALIRARGGGDLREVEVFDVYRGAELPDDTRSVAVRLRFQAEGRTLKDEEVQKSLRGITRALKEELGVRLRTSEA